MRIDLAEFHVPESLGLDDMPDLLRHWYLGPPARRHMMLRRFAEVAAELRGKPGDTVLDIGSAWGFNAMALECLGYTATALDLVVDQFPVGRLVAAANGVRLEAVGASAAALPFPPETFDFITMVETFEHIYLEDRAAAMSECHRVLKPGGCIVLSTPNYNGIVEWFKRVVGDREWLRRKFHACYADEGVGREDYHPYRYHQPMPDARIAALLTGAGFHVEHCFHFLFMLKETSDWLFAAARTAESIAERLPLVRKLAATACFTARK